MRAGLSAPGQRPARGPGLRRLAVLALIALVLVETVHAVAWVLTPLLWILVAAAVVMILVRRPWRR